MQRSKEKKEEEKAAAGAGSGKPRKTSPASAKRAKLSESAGRGKRGEEGKEKRERETVLCPLCGSSMPLFAINAHMDFTCTRRPGRATAAHGDASKRPPEEEIRENEGEAEAAPHVVETQRQTVVSLASDHLAAADVASAASHTATPAEEAAAPPRQEGGQQASSSSASAENNTTTKKMKPVPATQRTGTVHDFFGGQDHTVPGFFVLDTSVQPWHASFLRRRPAGAAKNRPRRQSAD